MATTDKNIQILLALYNIAKDFIIDNIDWIDAGKTTTAGICERLKYVRSNGIEDVRRINIDGCRMEFLVQDSVRLLRKYENAIGVHTGLTLYRAERHSDVEFITNKRFAALLAA